MSAKSAKSAKPAGCTLPDKLTLLPAERNPCDRPVDEVRRDCNLRDCNLRDCNLRDECQLRISARLD